MRDDDPSKASALRAGGGTSPSRTLPLLIFHVGPPPSRIPVSAPVKDPLLCTPTEETELCISAKVVLVSPHCLPYFIHERVCVCAQRPHIQTHAHTHTHTRTQTHTYTQGQMHTDHTINKSITNIICADNLYNCVHFKIIVIIIQHHSLPNNTHFLTKQNLSFLQLYF